MSNQQEFLRLFLASERDIYRYVSSLVPYATDTQDIVQQTAVVLWEKFDQYDPDRPFTPWACRFALNVARQWMDRQRRWKSVLDDGLADLLVKRREELKPQFDERLQQLDQCVKGLSGKQQLIIESYYTQKMDIEEVAAHAQKSVAATYKALQRIRERLRQCVEHTMAQAGESDGLSSGEVTV